MFGKDIDKRIILCNDDRKFRDGSKFSPNDLIHIMIEGRYAFVDVMVVIVH